MADVLADGRVRAAAGLDGADALARQRLVAVQELGVLAREDVVGDDARGCMRSRSARQSARTSAVLPLPTGPPMPTVKARWHVVAADAADRARERAPDASSPRASWSWSCVVVVVVVVIVVMGVIVVVRRS